MEVTQELVKKWKNNQRIANFFTEEDQTEIKAIGVEHFVIFNKGYWKKTGPDDSRQVDPNCCYQLHCDYRFQVKNVPRKFAVTTASFESFDAAYYVADLKAYLADVKGFVGYIGIEYKESPNNVFKSHQWENRARMSNPPHINTAEIENIQTLTPAFVWMWSTK